MVGPLPCIGGQIISETNPRHAIFDPGVIAWRHCGGFIEAANGDINFVGIWFGQEGEWRATPM
jgi:hypothetical protein